jgi:uncharacterized membrane protein HdeD (DUF308 family)
MTEPATAVAAAAASVGLAAMLPGVDGNALIGAFAGAALFVVSSKELPIWRRLVYLAVSIALGYLAAPEVIRWLPLKATGLAAFLASALGVTLTLGLIERGRTFDLEAWLRSLGGPHG